MAIVWIKTSSILYKIENLPKWFSIKNRDVWKILYCFLIYSETWFRKKLPSVYKGETLTSRWNIVAAKGYAIINCSLMPYSKCIRHYARERKFACSSSERAITLSYETHSAWTRAPKRATIRGGLFLGIPIPGIQPPSPSSSSSSSPSSTRALGQIL